MDCKTVGELVKALKKFPSKTRFMESTKGYYQVRRECEVMVLGELCALTDVKKGKVVEVGKKKQWVTIGTF